MTRLARLPQAVIFDMDGLMLDTERLAARAWDEAAAAEGATFDAALALRMIGRNFADCSAMMHAAYPSGYPVDAVLGRWQAAPRLSLSAAYARGNESFDIVSVDRLGRFRADTVAGGARIDLRSLTSIGVGVEHQWRSGDRQLTRVTLDLVQHF